MASTGVPDAPAGGLAAVIMNRLWTRDRPWSGPADLAKRRCDAGHDAPL